MKKIKEYMEALGFNKDASEGAKKAFINHLIREAHFQEVRRNPKSIPVRLLEPELPRSEVVQQEDNPQLCFDLASSDDQ